MLTLYASQSKLALSFPRLLGVLITLMGDDSTASLRKLAVKNQKRKEEQLEKIIKEQEDAGKKDKLKENVLARIAT